MSRKIILNLAISIDGYIASEDGGFDWIVGDGDKSLDTEKKWDFNGFLDTIDVVVMGKNCYDQNFHKDFKNKKVYIATSKDLKDYENIYFIKGDIVKTIEEEKQKNGENIFLFGEVKLLIHL
ncbi:dihydrofolate reductase family protein [Paraclostridium benzoelyticum]|uniref:dihydrofolate reductase family protein n=1 Tax=Paraclostridium benzoelyticum TaxID=1629550 RepID=UPI0031CD45A3